MTYAPSAADLDALVTLSAARQIDPRGVLAMLTWESGFDPSNEGPGGTGDYTGLNQMSQANLAKLGLSSGQWVMMSAADQLPIVFRFWDSIVHDYGGGAYSDAAHLYALNFVPNVYRTVGAATNADAPLAAKGSTNYTKNANLDPDGTGAITVNTIARRLALVQQSPSYQALAARLPTAPGSAGGTPGSAGGTVITLPTQTIAAPARSVWPLVALVGALLSFAFWGRR